jgi:hypothetical protein
MARLEPDDRAADLLRPVSQVVELGMSLLPEAPPLQVRIGPVSGFHTFDGDVLVLSDALVSVEMHHPDEANTVIPPLDRWRRAAASVLEGAALRELSRRTGLPIGSDWRWIGAAVHAADAVAPSLGAAAPEIALAVGTGDLTAHPRAGVAVFRAWKQRGVDPMRQTRYLLEGGIVSPAEWLTLGDWVFSVAGAGSMLPVHAERGPDLVPPATLSPWSWGIVAVPELPHGGRLETTPGSAVDDAWIPAGEPTRVLFAATTEPARVWLEPGAPLGTWDVASAEGFGQVMGGRGVGFTFLPDGRLEIVLADAFVGPLAAVAMAGQVGTSGLCTGRWKVAGGHLLAFTDIATGSLTLHGRSRDRFLVPAQGFGLGEWLEALADGPWAWMPVQTDRLVLRGRMLGGDVEVRLRRG